MTYEYPGAGALDYQPCRYGRSKLVFRGPSVRLDVPYDVALGGTETYGKFIAQPFAAQVGAKTGRVMLNLGGLSTGPDCWLHDPILPEVAARARVKVVQVTGAHNMTNPLYTVHWRRNDRFLAPTPALRRLYPEVDFTDFAFTGHLLAVLRLRGRGRFEELAGVLRRNWIARMGELLARLGGPCVLLWMARQPPLPPGRTPPGLDDPVLVDAGMLAALRPRVAAVVEAVAPPPADPAEGMVFAPLERAAAEGLPGPCAHRAAAMALSPVVAGLGGEGDVC